LIGTWTLLAVLVVTTVYGLWHKNARGRVREVAETGRSPLVEVIESLGELATLVQFSSAFCAPCRATKILLADIASAEIGIKHVDIDAESHLTLVRELHIRSTPTTLILDSSGREVGRAVGAPKREQVLSVLAALR